MTALPGYGLHVSVSKLFRRDTFGSNHMEAIIEVNPDVMKCVQFAEDFSCRHLYFTYIIHLIEGHYGPASRTIFYLMVSIQLKIQIDPFKRRVLNGATPKK